MIGLTADVKGDVLEGASAGATTVGNVACGGPNDAAFASRAAIVEADFRTATRPTTVGLPTYWEWKACVSGYYSRGINWLLFSCSTI